MKCRSFSPGVRRVHDVDRVLATVMFTDIVGSTEHLARMGDTAWREMVDRYHAIARREIASFRGREINTAGDGFFVTFDGPARGVRCAMVIQSAARQLGVAVRAGLHTGEVVLHGDDVAGMAVHIGAPVAGLADGDETLVSSTVKDLVSGSGLHFHDRGTRVLKGIPGEWRLYAQADRRRQQ